VFKKLVRIVLTERLFKGAVAGFDGEWSKLVAFLKSPSYINTVVCRLMPG